MEQGTGTSTDFGGKKQGGGYGFTSLDSIVDGKKGDGTKPLDDSSVFCDGYCRKIFSN